MEGVGSWPLIVATCLTSVLAYLSTRDKLRFDSERKDLVAQVSVLTARTDTCEKEREKLKQEQAEDKKEIKQELDECRESHKAIRDEIFAKVNQLIRENKQG